MLFDVLVSKGCWLIWLSSWCSLMYQFPKAVDLFGFPVDAPCCTSFQRLLIYLAFLLMLFGVLISKDFWFIWLSCWCSLMYWFPKAFDLFDFPVDALWCTSFQRLLIYLAFLLMLFHVLVSKGFWFIWLSYWCSLVYWFPKAFGIFGFPVDALWCTSFQRLLIYLAFLLMLFDVLVSKGF